MNIIHLTEDARLTRPCVATIGFFDGVHRGHRHLIATMMAAAREQGLETTVITFDRHPREVLGGDYRPKLLNTDKEKMVLLAQTGVDNCVVLPFNDALASLSARAFMQQILSDRLSVRTLVVGYDNRFGHNRAEGFADYVAYGSEMGIDVLYGEPFVINDFTVSASLVRSLLEDGEVEMAERCLGYPYIISGEVVRGEHVGTSLGFPTANILPDEPRKLVPAAGVYGVRVRLDGSMQSLRGMMNIGMRPTFDGRVQTLETHIFRFSGDLYGQPISVSFDHRLRKEKKFSGATELAEQLAEDMREIEETFKTKMEERG